MAKTDTEELAARNAELEVKLAELRAEADEHGGLRAEAERKLAAAHDERRAYQDRKEQRDQFVRSFHEVRDQAIRATRWAEAIDTDEDEARQAWEVWNNRLRPFSMEVAAILRDHASTFGQDGLEAAARQIETSVLNPPASQQQLRQILRAFASEVGTIAVQVQAITASWVATAE